MKKKIKVTHEELGKILFMFIYKATWTYFSDEKSLKGLRLNKKDRPHLILEAMVALFFLTLVTLDNFLNKESLEKKVFDSMHKAFYKGLDVDKRNRGEIKKLFALRCKEYQRAMKEKRGPNWLWPFAHHVLNNLRQKETKDAFVMTRLTAFLTSVAKQIPDLVDNYKTVQTKEK